MAADPLANRLSWQARLCAAGIRVLVRRENWGTDRALVRRARWVFGAPRLYGRLRAVGLTIRPSMDADARGEWLEPREHSGRVILYIHGGGFVSCAAATHRPVTSALARAAGATVFAHDYPLAPEFRYPAAVDAVLGAYRWLLSRDLVAPTRLAIVGDSAGGNLALSLLVRARDEGLPLPACGVALSPWLDLSGTGLSVRANDGRCAMFRPRNVTDFARAYLGSAPASEGHASPLFCDLSGLPPILLQVGSEELLLDDAVRAHEKIQSAGGACELQVFERIFHGWHMLDGIVPEARRAITAVAAFIGRHIATNGIPPS